MIRNFLFGAASFALTAVLIAASAPQGSGLIA